MSYNDDRGKRFRKEVSDFYVLITKSPRRFQERLIDTWERLRQAAIKLTASDYFRFWSELHEDNDIVFFRTTSRIDPRVWLENDTMKLYAARQIKNVESFVRKPKGDREKFAKAEKSYFHEKLKHPFERIFIIDKTQRGTRDVVDALARVIHEQTKNIEIRVVCIPPELHPNVPLLYRPLDFGIVMTEKKDVILMDLEVTRDLHPGGGRVIYGNVNPEEIERYWKLYKRIALQSYKIRKEWGIRTIKEKVKSLKPASLFENKCLACFLRSEDELKESAWKNREYSFDTREYWRGMWYEILEAENRAVENVFCDLQPPKVLEIGCGPGRIIHLLLDAAKERKIPISRIVGFEQNEEIYQYAVSRFDEQADIVYIRHRLFGNNGYSIPYDDDYFDLTIGVSNIVGWQANERKWMEEVIRVSRNFFFTVYNKDKEDDRLRIYAALDCPAEKKDNEIVLSVVDFFGSQPHVTKSYEERVISNMVEDVCKKFKGASYKPYDLGPYMFGFLIRKTPKTRIDSH